MVDNTNDTDAIHLTSIVQKIFLVRLVCSVQLAGCGLFGEKTRRTFVLKLLVPFSLFHCLIGWTWFPWPLTLDDSVLAGENYFPL